MSPKVYAKRRAELLKEYLEMKRMRLYLCARARVRKIAKLDFEYDGTPIEETYRRFDYKSENKAK